MVSSLVGWLSVLVPTSILGEKCVRRVVVVGFAVVVCLYVLLSARCVCKWAGGLAAGFVLARLPSPQPLSRPADERCVSQRERGFSGWRFGSEVCHLTPPQPSAGSHEKCVRIFHGCPPTGGGGCLVVGLRSRVALSLLPSPQPLSQRERGFYPLPCPPPLRTLTRPAREGVFGCQFERRGCRLCLFLFIHLSAQGICKSVGWGSPHR